MATTRTSHRLSERFLRLVNLYVESEKRPLSGKLAGPLTRAEIHTIEAIGNNPGISVTRLACVQGISKSAVSQMLVKLKVKKLVIQSNASGSDRDTELSLTKTGRSAFREHAAGHARLYAELDECMAAMGEEATHRLIRLFDRLEEFLRTKGG